MTPTQASSKLSDRSPVASTLKKNGVKFLLKVVNSYHYDVVPIVPWKLNFGLLQFREQGTAKCFPFDFIFFSCLQVHVRQTQISGSDLKIMDAWRVLNSYISVFIKVK